MSGLIVKALEQELMNKTLEEIFAEWNAEDGGPSAEDYAWAERVLEADTR